MRLREILEKKRDHHLALAGKFVELLAVLEGDDEIAGVGHRAARKIMNGAKHAAGAAPALTVNGWKKKKPTRKAWSASARRKQAAIMRARWKDPKIRRKLLKGLAAGRANDATPPAPAPPG